MMQMTLHFRPGLTQEYRSLRAVTQSAVLRARGGIAAIAPGVDMSPSTLGRKLQGNQDDPHRTLDVDDFDRVLTELAAQGDLSPLHWLIEKYLPSDEQKRAAAVNQLSALMPQIAQLLSEAGAAPAKAARR